MVRYVRDEELIADALKQTRRGVRDVQRPTGTERAQTMDTAIQAAADSAFAKDLAEQLEGELGPLPGQIQTALGEAAAALEESGLARSEAATAVADASAAVADATQAIEDAGLAQAAADGAATAASDAQTVAGAAQLAADAAARAASASDVFIQDTAPRANLAPAIKGDGTWAEVRRNWIQDPLFETTGVNWSTVTPGWTITSQGGGSITLEATHDTPSQNFLIPLTGWSAGISGVASASYRVENLSETDAHFRLESWNGTIYTNGEAVIIPAGETREVNQINAIVPDGSPYFQPRLRSRNATIPTGSAFRISQPQQEQSPVLESYFDGSTTPETAAGVEQPEDFRWRWLGTPNASESVMEIERVRGLGGTNAIAGVSAVGGKPAARVTPTGSSIITLAQFPIPVGGARTSSTLLGTVHLSKPLTGSLHEYSRRASTTSPAFTDGSPPNAAGSYERRVYSGALTGVNQAYFWNGGRQGSGDVWWTDIGLYVGAYDGPNLVMENILWIDTTGGNNTPKRWNGTGWAAVTDKAATDAAAAAVAAQSKADQAFADAAAAATAAGNAQTSANGKNRVWYQGTAPAGTGHKTGDTWFDTSNGNRVTQWDGDSWEVTQFGTGAIATAAITNALIADATIQSAKIANLDAAKITTGTLDAARIAALSITTGHLAANAVTAAKIAALTITAAEIASNAVTAVKIAADAVTAEKINAGAVTTVKLDALAVTAEKIAAGAIIADKIKANAITTAKLAVDAIDGMTITGALIRTAEAGQRVQLDVNGLRTFNASDAETARLYSDGTGLRLTGKFRTESGSPDFTYAEVGEGRVQVGRTNAAGMEVALGFEGVTASQAGQYISFSNDAAGPNSGARVYGRGVHLEAAAEIKLDAPVVTVNGKRQGLIASGDIGALSQFDITGLTGADRYEITLILPVSSEPNDIVARLMSGTSANTSSVYDRISLVGSGTAAAAGEVLAWNLWSGLAGGKRAQKTIRMTLMNLNRVEPTFADVVMTSWNATANPQIANIGLRHRTASSFDGVRFIVPDAAGTVSGRYEVRAL